MKFKFIDITELKGPVVWPEPRNWTPEEEAELIAQYKAQRDPKKMEAEYRELLEQFHRGELVDASEVFPETKAEPH